MNAHSLWRQPTDDTERSPLFNGVQQYQMTHPGYNGRDQLNAPPSVRVGTRLACMPLSSNTPSTSELRRALRRLLHLPAINDLVVALTAIEGFEWIAWDSNGRFNHGAVLVGPSPDLAPTAWARVLLPEAGTARFGRDPRCADFVLYVEPRTRRGDPAPPVDLASWHRRFTQALVVPDAVTTFLTEDLALSTPGTPTAKVGIWLTTPADLTQLVTADQFERLPGCRTSSWFHGYAVADPAGETAPSAAREWTRQMCDDSLHIDGYERTLLTFGR